MLRKIQKTRIFNTKSTYYSSILGTVLAIILTIFLVCVCWTLHVLRRNRDKYGKKYSTNQTFLKRLQDYILYKSSPKRTYTVQRQHDTPYMTRRQANQEEVHITEEVVEVATETLTQPRAEPRTIH